jgi:hypothetical protein
VSLYICGRDLTGFQLYRPETRGSPWRLAALRRLTTLAPRELRPSRPCSLIYQSGSYQATTRCRRSYSTSSSLLGKLRLTGQVASRLTDYLFIYEAVERQLAEAATHAHPLETGGILLGVKVGRAYWVTSAIEVTAGTRGPSSFWLPRGVTRSVIDAARSSDERIGYVGEWHVHPLNQGPSGRDAASLKRLAVLTRRGVVLLLVVRVGDHYLLRATKWSPVGSRDLALVRTGPLPKGEPVIG